MRRVSLLGALLVALLVSLVTIGAVAQEATPIVGGAQSQDVTPIASPMVGDAACTVEPRPTEELLAFWFGPEGTPLATPLPASPVAGEAALPEGEAADEETVAAVNATLRELSACFATNQFARAFALMTDDLVRKFGPQQGETLEQARDLLEAQRVATPEAREEPTAVPPLRDVRVLADGRVGGILEEEGTLIFVLFERQEGRWLIADFFEAGPAGATPVVGTPVTVGEAAAEASPV